MVIVIEAKDVERQIVTLNKWFSKSKIPRAYKINLLTTYEFLSNSNDPKDKELFYELYDVINKLKL